MSGCASIMNEKTQTINVASSNGNPIEGTINGMPFKGPGPVQVVRENKAKLIEVSTPGCTKSTSMENDVDPKFFVNVLSGGPFGSSTDYGTEKMWKYAENVTIACK